MYQSRSAPIPNIAMVEGSRTLMRLLFERILNASDPRSSYFVNSMGIWCDSKTKKTVLSKESLNILQEALSPMVLYALDRIASFNIVKNLYVFCELQSQLVGPMMNTVLNEIASIDTMTLGTRSKIFDNALAKFSPISSRFIGIISKVGS
ncbi:unnamed protein product [Gongylonema pulchrum]|uniref:Uncharacterized protein n=1 Tax=Gongylonema pulchrum TaxID=637853 RepID=A0A3P6QDB8_9BILA|nr:unnamed protein product [Gongylonema pulchrum]